MRAGLAQRDGEGMKQADKYIFCFLMLLSLLGIVLSNLIFAGGAAEYALVEVNGKHFGTYLLHEKDGKILDVKTEFGYNKIVIENGMVRIVEADCPDRLDVFAGEISQTGEMLVCLPNRLVVRILGEGEVDGLAY